MAAEGKEGGRLQRSEEHFRRVVESAPNAIVMIGHTGLIEMVNAEAERVFGYIRNELIGKPVEMLVPERYRPKHSGLGPPSSQILYQGQWEQDAISTA